MRTFSMITVCVLVAVGIFTTVIEPVERMHSVVIWQILGVSFLCAATTLVYSFEQVRKRGVLRLQIMFHYLIINVVVLGSGFLFDWYDVKSPLSVLAMVILIAVIYALVTFLLRKKASEEARKMNARLLEYQNHTQNRE
ncbi:MAG: DUF3021 domain-containing protein [Blautia sp.]|nr:DUF3021 domain-containing protein [Blautia sp.]